MENKITITLEEYKELLIIKGKYEELKSNQNQLHGITYRGNDNKTFEYPYKVTGAKRWKLIIYQLLEKKVNLILK